MPADLSKAVDALFTSTGGCWRMSLEGDADAFLSLVDERIDKEGRIPKGLPTRLLDKLNGEFKVSITTTPLRNHLKRKCACFRD